MRRLIFLLGIGLMMSTTVNATIVNGDFSSCDFTGWGQDAADLGLPAGSQAFSIANNGGNCSAEILVDEGIISSGFVNTLFTSLDLTADPTDTLTLSFDWAFSGTDGDPLGDFFSVFLSDGSGNTFDENGDLGFLIDPTSDYGSGTFSMDLSASLFNALGWTLEFQVIDMESLGNPLFSVLNIDNVALTRTVADVPAPAAALLLLLACGVYSARRTQQS